MHNIFQDQILSSILFNGNVILRSAQYIPGSNSQWLPELANQLLYSPAIAVSESLHANIPRPLHVFTIVVKRQND